MSKAMLAKKILRKIEQENDPNQNVIGKTQKPIEAETQEVIMKEEEITIKTDEEKSST